VKRRVLVALALAFPACCVAEVRASEPGSPPAIPRPVTYQDLLDADAHPGDWLTYSGQYHSRRHSQLRQIQRRNVGQLAVKWVYQLQTLNEVETSPLVVDGVMYLTRSPSDVIALDVRTGRPYWIYEHRLPEQVSLCCGKQNRGAAVLGERVYVTTLDNRLIALDTRTGSVIWDIKVADEKSGYSMTAAPLAVKDKIITGMAGGEFGVRGFLDAYDAKTGQRAWRFYTIPAPGEPGSETWEGASWKTGGGPTWVTGSFDPDLNLLYWGVGNPAPDWNGKLRGGDNLYTDSVLALDPDTGALKWYFQFTPHDVHDWDCTQVPVLADAEFRGRPRQLMLWPNRNGFFYVLDRRTGEFLQATEFAKQTWAERIDAKGRPVVKPGSEPSEAGTLIYPDANGAANWWSPTYSPRTGLLYVTAYDGAEVYFSGPAEHAPGQMFMGSSPGEAQPVEKFHSAVRALDPQTGERRWEYPLQPKSTAGLLSTAGDIVFGGSVDGYFYALDALTGKELWGMNLGGRVHAAPITYLGDGRQYVSIAAGSAIFTFGL
jgi:alcohol dehydrogenase (cytochrome c)